MTNRLKGACGGGFCARLLLLALVTAPVTGFPADSATGAQKPEAGVTATKAVAESAPSLAEILTAMEALETGERKLRLLLADEERLRTLAAEIDEIEKAFSGIRRLADSVLNDLVGFHELVDLTGTLRAADQRLAAASDELASSASALDAGLDRIGAADAKTGTWMKTAEKRNAPPALVERIQGLAPRHEALARELRAHRDQVLETLGRATQLHGAVSALRIDVSERRDQLTAALRSERGEPIWRVESHPGEWDRIMQFFDVQVAPSFRHARDHASLLLAIAVTAFALTYWLIVATREPLAAEAEMESHARRIVNLFRVPALSSLAAALMVVIGFGPRGPFNYHIMLWAFLLLLGVLLVRRVVGPHASLSLYTLAAALIAQMLFGAFFDPLPLVSRLLLIAECGALAVALGMDLGRGHFERLLPGLPAALVGWAARGIIILLAMAVLATVTGHLGAARVLRNLVLGGLGFWVLVSVVAAQLYGFSLALMHTGVGRSLRIVRLHRGAVRNSLRSAVIFVALVGWVWGMVLILGLGDEVSRLVDLLYHYEIKIGSTSIDLTGVWVGLAVVLGTIVAVKIVGPLLELEILPRFIAEARPPVRGVHGDLLSPGDRRNAACDGGNGNRSHEGDAARRRGRRGYRLRPARRGQQFRVGGDPADGAPGQRRRRRADGPIARRGPAYRRALEHHPDGPGRGGHRAERRSDLQGSHELDAVGSQTVPGDRRSRCLRHRAGGGGAATGGDGKRGRWGPGEPAAVSGVYGFRR